MTMLKVAIISSALVYSGAGFVQPWEVSTLRKIPEQKSNASPVFRIQIVRNMTCSDESTIGRLLVNGEPLGRTLELPDRNNEPYISRIAAGTYPAVIRADGIKGWRVQLDGVPHRDSVQIHVGNYARDVEGCILVGKAVKASGKECAVTESKAALQDIRNRLNAETNGDIMSKDVSILVQIQ